MQVAEAVRKAGRFPSGAGLRMNIGHAACPVPTGIMAHQRKKLTKTAI